MSNQTVVCAWCKKIIEWGENSTQDFASGKITHGICTPCVRELEQEIEKLAREHKIRTEEKENEKW